jgi:two-component system LytT family response regulator
MDTVDISAIIIDDDSEAINLLEMFLRQFPDVKVIGKSTDARTGLAQINEKFPDLVFLDIDMPEMSGLQVAQAIKNKNFHSEIVFTTAYQDYAYKALEVEPLDFLTKPFCPEDLENVIKKYLIRTEKKKNEQKLDKFIQSQSNPPKISLPTIHSFLLVGINDIVYVKSDYNCTLLYLQDGTVETLTRSLSTIISMINSTLIFQIHRTTYINLNYLLRINKKKKICIIRYNNTIQEEPISKTNLINFEKLNIFPSFDLLVDIKKNGDQLT